MEPEDLRGIHAVNARQRVLAVLIAVDTGQRHVPVHFLQQTEPFPDKPGSDRLAGWLSAQHLASRFADASSERIVAVVPAGLAVIFLYGAAVNVIAPANAVQLRQEVVRNLRSRAFQRVTGSIPAPLLLSGQRAVLNKLTPGAVVLPAVPAKRVIVTLFPYQVITVIVIQAARPAARRRSLGIASEFIPAMQSTKMVILAAGCKQSPGAAILKVESFVAGILTIY